MSTTLIDTLKNITKLIDLANYYINSDEAKTFLPHNREQLIDSVTDVVCCCQITDYQRLDIKALVTELVDRKLTDDHGWFIDIHNSDAETVFFVHPQRTKPEQRLALPKRHILLPFNLLA